jgi:hypothetical protein
VSQDTGNPAPAAVFHPGSMLSNYSEFLLSNNLDAVDMTEGIINLVFDIKLSTINASAMDSLLVQVWNASSGEFHTVKQYDTGAGSFAWQTDSLNISMFSKSQDFRIRFFVGGQTTSNINYWAIDNIEVYRICPMPLSCSTMLINDTCFIIDYFFENWTGLPSESGYLDDQEHAQNTNRFFMGFYLWLSYNGELSILAWCDGNTYPNPCSEPICRSKAGEYCIYLEPVFESPTDYCSGGLNLVGCEQIIHSNIDELRQNDVLIYPNPANNFITVSSSTKIQKLILFNPLGDVVKTIIPDENPSRIDLSDLNSGFYIIQIETNQGLFSDKLLIHH